MSKKAAWALFIFLAVGVGLYPLAYLLFDMKGGLLATKPADLLQNRAWQVFFYTHISLGGVALLTGWSQFMPRFRARHLDLHRTLGKIYVAAVMLSGAAGLYVAFFATGGLISSLGFGALALLWVGSTWKAYDLIRKRAPIQHKHWMIRSYALCFAAVTLRLWMPLLIAGFRMPFEEAYPIIAWLCWVPNLLVAEVIVRRKRDTTGGLKLAIKRSNPLSKVN
jgi:uncharacterized membrane protein